MMPRIKLLYISICISHSYICSVLPHISQHIPTDVIVRSEQLAKLITQSERYSQFAYNRPLNSAVHEDLRAEMARISRDRLALCSWILGMFLLNTVKG